MKKINLIILVLLSSLWYPLSAQVYLIGTQIKGHKGEIIEENSSRVVMPTFQGGDITAFLEWISRVKRYPVLELDQMNEGVVTVDFTVGKKGRLKNIRKISSDSKFFTDEVKRTLELSPVWTPGQLDGRPVDVKYTVEIFFDPLYGNEALIDREHELEIVNFPEIPFKFEFAGVEGRRGISLSGL